MQIEMTVYQPIYLPIFELLNCSCYSRATDIVLRIRTKDLEFAVNGRERDGLSPAAEYDELVDWGEEVAGAQARGTRSRQRHKVEAEVEAGAEAEAQGRGRGRGTRQS